jgi:polysaccharide pyruvyl transferase WcaK-like protein
VTAAQRDSDGTVAVWGTFDLDNFGDQLYPRITEDEIVRRLPGWMVRSFAPLGWTHPCRMDGGFVSEPLGPRTQSRTKQLAAAADLTLIGGGDLIQFDADRLAGAYRVDSATMSRIDPAGWFVDGLGAEPERRHPVIWNAVEVPADVEPEHADLVRAAVARRKYVAVRDEASARRLHDCGVDRELAVVPDIGVLMHRLIRTEALRNRISYFRLMGWYPVDRPALIVQGDRSAVPLAKEIAKVIRWALEEQITADVVLLETGPCHGDGEFADLLAEQLDPKRTYRLPAGLPVEDVLAAINGSIGTVATSFHGTLAAAMLGRRWAILNGSRSTGPLSLAELLDAPEQHATNVGELAEAIRVAFAAQPDPSRYEGLRASADRHFDVVAEEADRAWRVSGGDSAHRWAAVRRENAQLRVAYADARRRLAAERRKLLDRMPDGPGLAVTGAAPTTDLARLRADSAELERLLQTKLVRWSRPARRVYSKLTGKEL